MEHMIKKVNDGDSYNKTTIISIYDNDEHALNTIRCNHNETCCLLHSSLPKTSTTKTITTILKTSDNNETNNNNDNMKNGYHHLINKESILQSKGYSKFLRKKSKTSNNNRQLKAISSIYVSDRIISNKITSASNHLHHLFNHNKTINNNNDKQTICVREQSQQQETTLVQHPLLPQVLQHHLVLPTRNVAMLSPTIKSNMTWTKRWTKWFSACGTDKEISPSTKAPIPTETKVSTVIGLKRARTKSENDISKRGNVDHDEKKKFPTTSTFTVDSSTRLSEDRLPRRQEQRVITRLKVNNDQNNNLRTNSTDRLNTNSTITYRDKSDPRRYSQPSSNTLRSTQRSTTTTPSAVPPNQHHLSKSVDRITSTNRSRRELRYEEHDDFIPPPQYREPPPQHQHLANIQCHPAIDQYNRNLNTTVYHPRAVPLYENNNQQYGYPSQFSLARKSQIDHIQPNIQVQHLPPPLPLSQYYTTSTSQAQYYRQIPVAHYSTPSSYNLRQLPERDNTIYRKINNNEHRIVTPSNSSTLSSINSRLKLSVDTMADDRENNNHTYGKLSDCRSLIPSFDNSTNIKAPRRIQSQNEQRPTRSYSPTSQPYQNDLNETKTLRNQTSGGNYAQFPVTLDHSSTEPFYANTQSLYDNIVYPQSATNKRNLPRNQTVDLDGMLTTKSCASQTQLTWTMATFSSFVDLENQSIIIPQPDPATFYSIGNTISPYQSQQHIRKLSPTSFETDTHPHQHHHHHTKSPVNNLIEKRDNSFQTLLTFSPFDDNSNIDMQLSSDGTTPTVGTNSRKPTKSRLATRDVGLQVSIQTVKKITFSTTPTAPAFGSITSTPSLSEPSSATSTTTSPTTVLIPSAKEHRTIAINTEHIQTRNNHTQSAPQDNEKISPKMASAYSQTTKSLTMTDTKSQQTTPKMGVPRDQWVETTLNSTKPGLFFCDLSSVVKEGENSSLKKK